MKKIISVILMLAICVSSTLFIGTSCGGGKDTLYTCQVCGRTFDGGTSNSKSIIRTNMCSQCYKNYKYAQGM